MLEGYTLRMDELAGLTKREVYAAVAMHSLTESNLIRDPIDWNSRVQDDDRVKMVADLSVKFADALMERLKASANATG